MRKYLTACGLAAFLLLPSIAVACSTVTYFVNGKTIVCVTCCNNGSNCSTVCS
jgi:hypothetical protein